MTSERQPLVSVIMIFRNAESFIASAIESVLAQTYACWELVLVDDGSTDASREIARQFAAEFPLQIRYVQHQDHQNHGMSASRNLGIACSRGTYIAFLDADDMYLPQKLERQVTILESCDRAAMVYGATLHWYSWTGRPEDQQRDQRRRLGVPGDTLVEPPTLIPLYLRLKAQTPGTCGVLIRRAAISDVGGFEERFRGMFEDQVFFYKLCLRKAVFVEAGSWDRYRQHPLSHSQIMRRRGVYRARGPSQAYRSFLEWLQEYLSAHDICDAAVHEALRQEVYPFRHPLRYRAQRALHALRDR